MSEVSRIRSRHVIGVKLRFVDFISVCYCSEIQDLWKLQTECAKSRRDVNSNFIYNLKVPVLEIFPPFNTDGGDVRTSGLFWRREVSGYITGSHILDSKRLDSSNI